MFVRTGLMLVALLSFLSFGALTAHAAETMTVDVTIVKVEDGKLFVSKEGKEHNAPMGKDCKIIIDGKDKSASDLKADMKAKVTLEKGDGKITVVKVEVKS